MSINTSIPNGPNDPADDQVEIRSNFVNINSYVQVDHTDPGIGGNRGFHKKVTYNAVTSPTVTDPAQIVGHSAAGVADPTSIQRFNTNDRGTFPASAVRAVCSFTYTAAPTLPTLVDPYNIVATSNTVAGSGVQTYTFTITSGAIDNDSVILLVTRSSTTSFTSSSTVPFVGYQYSITGNVVTVQMAPAPSLTPATLFQRCDIVVLQI